MNERILEQQLGRDRFLAGAICFIGFLLGIETGGLQFILLKAANEFHLSQTSMGSIVTVQFAAVTITPLVVGFISDRIGKKKVILSASLLFACGSLLSILSAQMGLLLVGVVLIGFAFGSLETTITAALSDTFGERSGRYISIMQGCLSFGAVLSPLAVNLAIEQWNFNWRVLFWVCLIFAAAGGIAIFFAKFHTVPQEDRKKSRGKLNFRDLFLIGAFLVIAFYMIAENNTTCFIDSFYANVLKDSTCSAAALSGFWAAMTISRFAFSALHEKRHIILPLLCAAAAVLLAAMNWLTNPIAVLVCLFAIGICYGPMSPFIMNMAVERYPEQSGTTAGLMLGFMGAGGAVGPVLGGYIADTFGLRLTYLSTGIVTLLMFAIFLLMVKLFENRH
ncbi:MAG: MFS transporter [Clostridia bacterium]